MHFFTSALSLSLHFSTICPDHCAHCRHSPSTRRFNCPMAQSSLFSAPTISSTCLLQLPPHVTRFSRVFSCVYPRLTTYTLLHAFSIQFEMDNLPPILNALEVQGFHDGCLVLPSLLPPHFCNLASHITRFSRVCPHFCHLSTSPYFCNLGLTLRVFHVFAHT